MKRVFMILSLVVLSTGVCKTSFAEPAQGSAAVSALQKYQKRPQNELSKLIYLMDVFRGSDYKVVYDKMEYDSTAALQTAKNYIAKHYSNQNALAWVKEHSYRSAGGQIIYLKSADGKSEILRDALVRELKTLK